MENNVNNFPDKNMDYGEKVSTFLALGIVSVALMSMPIGSIVAIVMGSKNRKSILEYLENGGIHTTKIKVSSILSNVGKYGGIGYTILWGLIMLYYIFLFAAFIIALIFGTKYAYTNGF